MRQIGLYNFFGVPSRSGWLTILNCAFFAAAFSGMLGDADPKHFTGGLVLIAAILLSMPLAIFVLLPQLDYSPALSDIIVKAVVVGFNAVVWGYGLSFLIRKLVGERRSAAA